MSTSGVAGRWRVLPSAAVVLALAWGAGALFYPLHGPVGWRVALVVAWLLLGVAALRSLQRGRTRPWLLIFVFVFGLVLAGWLGLSPRQDRDWAYEVSRLLAPQVDGDRVTLHNVRNFDWRTRDDYTRRWETRQYDLAGLETADLAMSYWMGPAIAHTLVSFGFADGQRVVFSLEIRRERTEAFSAVGGFFRQFEEVIIAADERDILRVRTNVRGEDVRLYRLDLPPERLREVFLGYLKRAQALEQTSGFYNTLTSNCTTIIVDLARQIAPSLPLEYRMLLSGYFDEYAYDHGGLMGGYGMPELKAGGRISERAIEAGDAADFSRRIRVGMPGYDSPVAP